MVHHVPMAWFTIIQMNQVAWYDSPERVTVARPAQLPRVEHEKTVSCKQHQDLTTTNNCTSEPRTKQAPSPCGGPRLHQATRRGSSMTPAVPPSVATSVALPQPRRAPRTTGTCDQGSMKDRTPKWILRKRGFWSKTRAL